MAYRFSPADLAFLASDEGVAALTAARARPLTPAGLLADLQALRAIAGEHAAAVLETVLLQRRAATKVPSPLADRWWWTDEALQQASPWPVALHRARRLLGAGTGVHDLTCSVGTDLAALRQVAGAGVPLLGSDLDAVRLTMAARNTGEPLTRADARTRTSTGLVRYADPARRSEGRRITDTATLPSVAELDAASPELPVLRLPPGIDHERLARPGEVEIVSLDGAAREAVLWPPPFTVPGVRRRATVLTGGAAAGWSLTDADDDGGAATAPLPADPVGSVLVDPDPAVVRAHLVRRFASRHGLRLLDEHLAYLVGPVAPPVGRAFRVLATGPLEQRAIGRWIRADGVGTVEIKQRGTGIDPAAFRRGLRAALRGGDPARAATLVLARTVRGHTALWCRPEPAAGGGAAGSAT